MDSTKVEIVGKALDTLASNAFMVKDKPSIWSTIIPLLIGAGLTLLTQFAMEFWKSDKEKRKYKEGLISKGRAKTYLISQLLRELAMYKAHKQYYNRASQIETPKEQSEDSAKKHYEKGQEQRTVESKLSEKIGDYFELVTDYTIQSGRIKAYQNLFQQIVQFQHPKSSRFMDCHSLSDLAKKLEEEEQRLNKEYDVLRNIFEQIQNDMFKEYSND